MKKILIGLVLMPLMVLADTWTDPDTGITWTYVINDGQAQVGGGSYGSPAIPGSTTGARKIPSTLGGYPVTSIGDYAFYECRRLTSVIIPKGVTSIGSHAFYNCNGLTSVMIPEGVTSIGDCAFCGCWGLTRVMIPEGVTSIGGFAFQDCSGLTSVTIPSSVTSIGDCAFSGCSGLTRVLIPEGVVSIGERMFYDCRGLTSVTIPSSVMSIGYEAFGYCYELASVAIPEGVKRIGNGAFHGCKGLKSVTIPSSVMSIGDCAFEGCRWLTSVMIPEGVTSIGDCAFQDCSGLTRVTISEGMMNIGWGAFYNCDGLTSVTIPSSVTGIGNDAFAGCRGLTSVTISEGVTGIGGWAFSGCSGLTSVTIPSSVTNIGDFAFYDCDGLAAVYVPKDEEERIKDMLLSSGLDLSTLPVYEIVDDGGPYTEVIDGIEWTYVVSNGEASVGGGDWNHPAIPRLDCGSWNEDFSNSLVYAESNGLPIVVVWGNTSCSHCNVLDDVLENDEMLDWAKRHRVVLVRKMEEYGSEAPDYLAAKEWLRTLEPSLNGYPFVGVYWKDRDGDERCATAFTGRRGSMPVAESESDDLLGLFLLSLEELIRNDVLEPRIPSVLGGHKVTGVGDFAFADCGGFEHIAIPQGVRHVGYGAFLNCAELEYVDIPASVDQIGACAFRGCGNLMEFSVDADNHSFKSENGLLLTKDGSLLVRGVNVYVVGSVGCEFCGHNPIGMMPSSVRIVGDYAFDACVDIGSVILPESITAIGRCAFYGCSGLESVTMLQEVPLEAGEEMFECCSRLEAIYVPTAASVKTYQTALGWSNYAHLIQHKLEVEFEDGTILAYFGDDVDVVIPEMIDGVPVKCIGYGAFSGCSWLKSVTIPSTVTAIEDEAFSGCGELLSVVMEGDAPDMGENVFKGTPKRLVVSVPENSIGWAGGVSAKLPEMWGDRAIVYSGESYDWGGGTSVVQSISMTITNIVVQYVFNSIQPQFAGPPSADTGFVNIIAEVKGGAVAVPASWAENYPSFVDKFGSDFTKALTKKTGKKDGAGNEMFVWQDYVAGTDPTDENDVFRVSITIVEGQIKISWTPELDAERAALRKYTTWGKNSLMDADWAEVPEGQEDDYNFFKVSVEMR